MGRITLVLHRNADMLILNCISISAHKPTLTYLPTGTLRKPSPSSPLPPPPPSLSLETSSSSNSSDEEVAEEMAELSVDDTGMIYTLTHLLRT